MSVNQGTSVINETYFTSMAQRAAACKSCAELQSLYDGVTNSVDGTVAAITQQLGAVTGQLTQLADQITKLTAHIGTLAATQTASTAVGTVAATAAAVNNLGSAIAYIQAQGLTLVTLGSTTTATLVEQALALNADLNAITDLYNTVVTKVDNLQAQLDGIPALLTTVQTAITDAATNFPGCSI